MKYEPLPITAKGKRLLAAGLYGFLEIPYKALNAAVIQIGRYRGRCYALLMPPEGTFVEQHEHEKLPKGPWVTGEWLSGYIMLYRLDKKPFKVLSSKDPGDDFMAEFIYVRPSLIRILPNQEKFRRRMR